MKLKIVQGLGAGPRYLTKQYGKGAWMMQRANRRGFPTNGKGRHACGSEFSPKGRGMGHARTAGGFIGGEFWWVT